MKRVTVLLVILFCTTAFAQTKSGELPKIAVYVTGDLGRSESRALGTEMLDALVKSGQYIAVERAEAFVAQINKEMAAQRSGAIDDRQISALGKRFGVQYICVADVAMVFDAHQMSARIINVETAQVVKSGRAGGLLNSVGALMVISNAVVSNMFGSTNETRTTGSMEMTGSAAGGTTVTKMPDMLINGFTVNQLRQARNLNIIPLGLGSLFIQQDYFGAAIGATGSIGIWMFFSSFDTKHQQVNNVHYRTQEINWPRYLLGLGIYMSSNWYSTLWRPGNYQKPITGSVANEPPQNLNFTVLPDTDGSLKAYAAYSIGF